jgi:hypothetical protein
LRVELPWHSIHATGFRSLDEGEDVEYVVEADQSGRQKTSRVTGPNGGFVKGAPRQFVRPISFFTFPPQSIQL